MYGKDASGTAVKTKLGGGFSFFIFGNVTEHIHGSNHPNNYGLEVVLDLGDVPLSSGGCLEQMEVTTLHTLCVPSCVACLDMVFRRYGCTVVEDCVLHVFVVFVHECDVVLQVGL